MKKFLMLFILICTLLFVGIFNVNALDVLDESSLTSCLTTEGDEVCELDADVTLTAPIISIEGKKIDLNGHSLVGDVVGIFNVNNGNYFTANGFHVIGGVGSAYNSNNASVEAKSNGDLVILSGTITLGMSMCTTPGQVITIKEGATFIIPNGLELQLYSLIKNEGTLLIEGELKQITTKEGGSLKVANPDLYNLPSESNAAVIGDINIKGGTYITWDPIYGYTPIAGKNAAYATDDAVFNLDEQVNITVKKGDVVLGASMNTMPNQTLTLNKDTKFTIPSDKTLYINDTTTLNIHGVLEISDISYFEKITLHEGGEVILHSADTLENVKQSIGDTYCIHEKEEGIYVIHYSHGVLEKINAVEATTEKDGYSGDLVCSKCGAVIEKGVTITKLIKNPETYDGIGINWLTAIISIIGLIGVSILFKKVSY